MTEGQETPVGFRTGFVVMGKGISPAVARRCLPHVVALARMAALLEHEPERFVCESISVSPESVDETWRPIEPVPWFAKEEGRPVLTTRRNIEPHDGLIVAITGLTASGFTVESDNLLTRDNPRPEPTSVSVGRVATALDRILRNDLILTREECDGLMEHVSEIVFEGIPYDEDQTIEPASPWARPRVHANRYDDVTEHRCVSHWLLAHHVPVTILSVDTGRIVNRPEYHHRSDGERSTMARLRGHALDAELLGRLRNAGAA